MSSPWKHIRLVAAPFVHPLAGLRVLWSAVRWNSDLERSVDNLGGLDKGGRNEESYCFRWSRSFCVDECEIN